MIEENDNLEEQVNDGSDPIISELLRMLEVILKHLISLIIFF